MERNEQEVIQCADGITARLMWLDVRSTYEGLLDGGPTHEINEMLIDLFASMESEDVPTHFVRPTQRLEVRTDYHDQMWLPRYRCRGAFASGRFELSIVWFQDTEAPPISPEVKAELRNLDFLAIAREHLDES